MRTNKVIFIFLALLSTACGNNESSKKVSDSLHINTAGGNTDGANTTGMDTAHLDTTIKH